MSGFQLPRWDLYGPTPFFPMVPEPPRAEPIGEVTDFIDNEECFRVSYTVVRDLSFFWIWSYFFILHDLYVAICSYLWTLGNPIRRGWCIRYANMWHSLVLTHDNQFWNTVINYSLSSKRIPFLLTTLDRPH